jgi:hypothetical protein
MPEGDVDLVANRRLWTLDSAFSDEDAARAWAFDDVTWGLFDVLVRDVRVLGDVAGLDVLELGCGTGYLSAWLARRGARCVGVDLTRANFAPQPDVSTASGRCFPSSKPTRKTCRYEAPRSTSWSASTGPACGAVLSSGSRRRLGCCARAGDWSSSPTAFSSRCVCRRRRGSHPSGSCDRNERSTVCDGPGRNRVPPRAWRVDPHPVPQRLRRGGPARALRPRRLREPRLLRHRHRWMGQTMAGRGPLGRPAHPITVRSNSLRMIRAATTTPQTQDPVDRLGRRPAR